MNAKEKIETYKAFWQRWQHRAEVAEYAVDKLLCAFEVKQTLKEFLTECEEELKGGAL
jgi:hypothetical protein